MFSFLAIAVHLLCVLPDLCTHYETADPQAQIDQLITPLVMTNNYAGSIAVAMHDKTIFQKSYGKMSLEYDLDNHSKSKFFLASASMMFTSAAIMKLVDEGKIDLEDPLSDYFPEYVHGEKITIHQLLAQRSGIPRIGRNGKVNYNEITSFGHSPQELLDYIWEDDLLFQPGNQYMHERTDYIFLAGIIEKVSGKSFGDYLEEEIFMPLGMENTGHYHSQYQIIENLCKGYAPKDLYGLESAPILDWSSKTGHASIYSTAEDLLNWGKAVLNRDLLSPQSWDQILTDHGSNVGYGWFISPHNGHIRFQMNGRSPGFSSYLAVYPERELVVSMLSNVYVSLPRVIGPEIASIFMNEDYKILRLSKKKLTSQEAQDIVGNYEFGSDFYSPNAMEHIRQVDGNIYGKWGGLIPVDEGNGKYRKFIYRTFWSDIEFIEGEDGKVSQMIFDEFKGLKAN